MLERIKEILNSEGLTSGSFADEIGVQRSSLSHILNGRNNPSLDFVIKTLQRFPGLNPEWFLLGKGDMYTNVQNEEKIEHIPAPSHDLFSALDEVTPVLEHNEHSEKVTNTADNEEINIEKPERYVSQVLIFYSDSTYQMLKPDNKA